MLVSAVMFKLEIPERGGPMGLGWWLGVKEMELQCNRGVSIPPPTCPGVPTVLEVRLESLRWMAGRPAGAGEGV